MNREEIIKKITSVFRTVFDDENLEINEESNSDNVKGWDSLNHIYLVVEIEQSFEMKFTAQEIRSWETVENIINSILDRQKQ